MSEEVKEQKVESSKPKEKIKEQKVESSKPKEKEDSGQKTESATEVKAVKKSRKKGRKNVPVGIVHILSSFNNTLVTVTDIAGNTISWSTSGSRGFKGSRKGTPFAAQLAAEDAIRKAMDHGMRSVTVLISGPGAGREAALRSLQKTGVKVLAIRDTTPIPHNGCRPSKRRRV